MSWAAPEVRKGSFDTETTGTSVTEDRIVTAALVVRGAGKPDRSFSWVIDPGVACPVEASEVHGWTTERLRAEGQDPKAALEDIAAKLTAVLSSGMPLVAFNAAFDWSILHNDLARHGLPSMMDRLGHDPITLIDALVLDRAAHKYRSGSRQLKDVAGHYGIELTDWHTAEADALAALLIAEEIGGRYPHLAAMAPRMLFDAQQQWAAEQAAGLQAYFRSAKAGAKQDPNAVIDGAWPLRGAS